MKNFFMIVVALATVLAGSVKAQNRPTALPREIACFILVEDVQVNGLAKGEEIVQRDIAAAYAQSIVDAGQASGRKVSVYIHSPRQNRGMFYTYTGGTEWAMVDYTRLPNQNTPSAIIQLRGTVSYGSSSRGGEVTVNGVRLGGGQSQGSVYFGLHPTFQVSSTGGYQPTGAGAPIFIPVLTKAKGDTRVSVDAGNVFARVFGGAPSIDYRHNRDPEQGRDIAYETAVAQWGAVAGRATIAALTGSVGAAVQASPDPVTAYFGAGGKIYLRGNEALRQGLFRKVQAQRILQGFPLPIMQNGRPTAVGCNVVIEGGALTLYPGFPIQVESIIQTEVSDAVARAAR